MVLFWILLVTILDGFLAFLGAFTLLFKGKNFENIIYMLVAFSAGTMMGGAFLHLLPEAIGSGLIDIDTIMLVLIGGFSAFFLIERFLHWHHCHAGGHCDVHTYSYLILIGDAVHNFIDGLVIAAAFLSDIGLGFVTSFLILAHEAPQEIGDFAVLLHAKMRPKKALFYNFLVQLTAVLGGLAGFFLFSEHLHVLMLPFAAGGFVYIAASDLVPELHKDPRISRAMTSFLLFLVGVAFMFAVKIFAGQMGLE